jgi:hypothetical protein
MMKKIGISNEKILGGSPDPVGTIEDNGYTNAPTIQNKTLPIRACFFEAFIKLFYFAIGLSVTISESQVRSVWRIAELRDFTPQLYQRADPEHASCRR